MLESIIYGVIAALVLIGIVSVVYITAAFVISPKGKGRYAVVIPADCDGEETARLMYAARMRLALLGESCCGGVYALDIGLTPEQRRICEAMCRECTDMKVCTPEEFTDIVIKG